MTRSAQVVTRQLTPRSLAATLASWDDDRLRALLARRPDLASPPPGSVGALAERAVAQPSAEAAYRGLDRSAQQVVEVLTLLPPPVPVTSLARLLAPGVSPSQLERPLARLESLALAFRDGDAVTPNPGLSRLVHRSGLGPPLAAALGTQTVPQLGAICKRIGLKPAATKAATLEAITGCVGHPDHVRRLLAKAPPGVAELVERAVRGLEVHGNVWALDDRTPVGWLALRGLLGSVDWYRLVMPGEVGLALRGGHVFDEFSPEAPDVPTVAADPAVVDAAGAEQALEVVTHLASVLEAWGAQPAKLLKDGGVGVRDVRKAAKAVGRSERDLARLLDVAVAAGLVWVDEATDAVLPTAAFDEWLRLEAAPRWARLVSGWLVADFDPSLAGAIDTKDKPIPPLLRRAQQDGVVERRVAILAAMAGLPSGRAAASAAALSARARWSSPQLWDDGPARPTMLADWVIEECQLLGLSAHGALTTAGRRVARGDKAGAAAAVAERAPASVDRFVLQADLTAVAAGTLLAEVAAELDLMADVESKGAATVYRFGEQSLRRAFDAGRSAADVAAFLDGHAARGVPQALSYLVADLGRRYGQARVGAARCYVRSDDVALLVELAQARAAARLRLRALAPTVLVTDAEPADVVTALRAAGYLPAEEDATGALVVARPSTRRAPPRVARRSGRGADASTVLAQAFANGDLDAMRAYLLDRSAPSGRPLPPAPPVDLDAVVAGLRNGSAPKPAPAARKGGAVSAAPPPAPPRPPKPAPSPPLFSDHADRPSVIAKGPEAVRQLLQQACDEEWPARISYTNGKGVTYQLNVIVADVSSGRVLVQTLPGYGSRTLSLHRVHWARALTEVEEEFL
jgi:hypothetical protein